MMMSWSTRLLVLCLSAVFLCSCRHPEVMGIDLVKGYSKTKGDQYFRKGAEAFNAHDYKKAYNAFMISSQYDSKNADSLTMAGYCKSIDDDYESAYDLAMKAVSIEDENPEANLLAATSLFMLKRWTEALSAFERLEKIAPSENNRVYTSRVIVYYFAGGCCMQLKKYVLAKEYFEKGLALKGYKSAPQDIISKIEAELRAVNKVLKTGR